MPMNRREFVAGAVAGAALLQRETKGFAVQEGIIQVRIDASVSGAPINPMIFGGYMEPATTQVWAEMLTDRKFANAITSAPTPPPANPFFRRFFGEPFKPVGPEELSKWTPCGHLSASTARASSLTAPSLTAFGSPDCDLAGGKAYEGRIYLAGDPGAKSRGPFGLGSGRPATRKPSRSLAVARVQEIPVKVHCRRPTQRMRAWKSWAPAAAHFTSGPPR